MLALLILNAHDFFESESEKLDGSIGERLGSEGGWIERD